MNKRYIVDLSEDERGALLALLGKGVASVRKLARARILLLADAGRTDQEIAAALHVHRVTVERARRRFVEGGMDRALNEQPRPGGRLKLDGKQEAMLVALACSAPPEGRAHWTMQLLADRLVALAVVDTISDETVRRALKKRPQALAEEAVVPRRRGGRLRLADGRCPRPLCPTL
jgi:transposase